MSQRKIVTIMEMGLMCSIFEWEKKSKRARLNLTSIANNQKFWSSPVTLFSNRNNTIDKIVLPKKDQILKLFMGQGNILTHQAVILGIQRNSNKNKKQSHETETKFLIKVQWKYVQESKKEHFVFKELKLS